MGRPLYPYELGDPDFSWLLSSFQENNPGWIMVESTCLPVVLVPSTTAPVAALPAPIGVPGCAEEQSDESFEKRGR